jgi:coenzyme PQQ precursor peptide PqqA
MPEKPVNAALRRAALIAPSVKIIDLSRKCYLKLSRTGANHLSRPINSRTLFGGLIMKIWTKPAVRETEVGLEVTSYLPADIDII